MVDFTNLFSGMSQRDIAYLLKNMVQKSINEELTNADISNIDNKTPVLITNSKDVLLLNDLSIQNSVNIEQDTVYHLPEEPDGKYLNLWLKFQNAGELRDYSMRGNKSYAVGANTMPGLFNRYNDDAMMKYELFLYFNGINHYAYSIDNNLNRILPKITAGDITSFFIRILPVSLSKVVGAERNSIFTKVDDDQLRYGYSVTIDKVGNINFYIKNDYRQYHLFIKNAYNNILTDPEYQSDGDFRFENFNQRNFVTNFDYLCSIINSSLGFDDWFFKYNPSTHNMSVIKTSSSSAASVIADTSLVTEPPYLSLPIQEGKWKHDGTVQTTVYDNSGNGNNGTIGNIAVGGQWNDDNTLTSLGSNSGGTAGGIDITLPSITAINTLTEFTMAFWYNPLTMEINTTSYAQNIIQKGLNVANSFKIFRDAGLNNLRLVIYNTGSSDFTSVTFSNAFPNENQWYLIVARWKTGEKLKLSINNVEVQSSTTLSMTITNAVNNLKLFDQARAPNGIITHFKFWNTQISQSTIDDLYYAGYHNPLFPKSENIQPEASDTPDPITVPFTNVYTLDKMTTPTAADYRKINSLSGNSPFVQVYSVADGVGASNPEVLQYSINDGATTANDPFVLIKTGSNTFTIDSSDNSSGVLGDNNNQVVGLWVDTGGTGIGDTIAGKKVTQATFFMRKESSTVTGTLYCRIWDSAGNIQATLGSISANSITQTNGSASSFTGYTFTNGAANRVIANGDVIGIEYTGFGSGHKVDVQRKSSNTDDSAYQQTRDSGGSWDSNGNTGFNIRCNLYTGSGTTSVEPNIIMKSGSYNRVVQAFGSGDTLINKILTKIILRLKKVGSPTGTATVALMNNASPPVVKATLGTIDVSTLTTTTADYTFTNYTHGQTANILHRIGIIWTPSASGEVHVMTNNGNTTSNSWNGTNSSVFKYISSWAADSAIDLSAKIYTGGDTFNAYLRFDTDRTRITVKAVNTQSSINNKKITKITARLKRNGSPTGILTPVIRDASDNIKITFSGVDVSTLVAAYQDVDFTNVVHNYLINSTGAGDKISLEYSGADATNYVEVNMNHDVLDASTLSTIVQGYETGNYVDYANLDMAGKMYSGGEPDLNSRTRVAQSIETQNSRLKGKKPTRVQTWLYRTTSATSGTAYCNIRRGFDDSLVGTIGTVSVSTLSTTAATPTSVTFTNTAMNYPLTVGDKITIEFNGGSSTDQLGVLVRNVTPNYDDVYSYIRKYDEFDYDDVETTMDLCALIYEGGFTYTPDPGTIPDPTPVNDKDLIIAAGNNKLSGFFECLIMEFRIYSKSISTTQADNLYNNRASISLIGPGELLMPFSFHPSGT